MPFPLPPKERILRAIKIDDVTGCWNWIKGTNLGYGRIGINYKKMLAHRVSYMDFVGDIPSGMQLDHLCFNRSCVNPSHLEPVSCAENVRRAAAIGLMDRHSKDKYCKHGHPYSLENTSFTPEGWRVCKICNREKRRRQRLNHKTIHTK